MKLLAVLIVGCGVMLAQRPGTPNPSPTGFGRLANPSGITPSQAGGGFGRLIYPATGGPPALSRGGTSTVPIGLPPVAHPAHGRGVVAPYPVIYGGYYYGYDAPPVAGTADAAPYYDQAYGYDQGGQSPVVIINQNFQPDVANPVMHDYSNVPLPPAANQYAPPVQPNAATQNAVNDGSQLIFLIAMQDHTIYPAVSFWVVDDTLNYVTPQGAQNRVTLDLVDRPFTAQLNKERGIDLTLPSTKQ
jgi:hypothetical protein